MRYNLVPESSPEFIAEGGGILKYVIFLMCHLTLNSKTQIIFYAIDAISKSIMITSGTIYIVYIQHTQCNEPQGEKANDICL